MEADAANVAIRPARHGDVDAVMRLWADHGSNLNRIPDDSGEIERLVAAAPGGLIIAECDDKIVGAVIAAFDGHRGHMHRLTVAASARGGGLGRRLVEAGHEHLEHLGARRVDAIVGVEEEAASALWRSAGYETDPSTLVRWARNL